MTRTSPDVLIWRIKHFAISWCRTPEMEIVVVVTAFQPGVDTLVNAQQSQERAPHLYVSKFDAG
jgi:hypothetical protein